MASTAGKALAVANSLNQATIRNKTSQGIELIGRIDAEWVDLECELPISVSSAALSETETPSTKAWMYDLVHATSKEVQTQDTNTIASKEPNNENDDDSVSCGSVHSDLDMAVGNFMSCKNVGEQQMEFDLSKAICDLKQLELRKISDFVSYKNVDEQQVEFDLSKAIYDFEQLKLRKTSGRESQAVKSTV